MLTFCVRSLLNPSEIPTLCDPSSLTIELHLSGFRQALSMHSMRRFPWELCRTLAMPSSGLDTHTCL